MRGTISDEMKRGFKAYAERLSLSARSELKLRPHDRLDAWAFLRGKGLLVWEPRDIPGIDPRHVEQLTVRDPDSWSGVMVRGVLNTAIIINSAHPNTRQANTLMHEWSHLELKHKPNRVDRFDHGIVMLSDYPAELEEEADWLAGAMLAPRDGLAYFARKGAENAEIAEHFGISEQLAVWRRRMTGIDRQFRS
jgi:Zn-dependent peptidase ImmA (M78 family)